MKPIDYTPRPTGKPIDWEAEHRKVMARYPVIMARLAASERADRGGDPVVLRLARAM